MTGEKTIEYIGYLESQLDHYKNMAQVNSARAYIFLSNTKIFLLQDFLWQFSFFVYK